MDVMRFFRRQVNRVQTVLGVALPSPADERRARRQRKAKQIEAESRAWAARERRAIEALRRADREWSDAFKQRLSREHAILDE